MTIEGQQLIESAGRVFAHLDRQAGDPQLADDTERLKRFFYGTLEVPIDGDRPRMLRRQSRPVSVQDRALALLSVAPGLTARQVAFSLGVGNVYPALRLLCSAGKIRRIDDKAPHRYEVTP